ncbi:MAG: caspase family protein [Candidatus Bathyarchaeota archaeon]|nr:MAG: caspase family protein [Candidatus Bathyarchaeota archaeon]
MNRRIFASTLVITLVLAIYLPFTAGVHPDTSRSVQTADLKRLDSNNSNRIKPTAAPLSVEIVYPDDGATLTQGSHRILVAAVAKDGVITVELKIDGPEALGWTDITNNFDGTHYFLDWTVSSDGSYDLTAAITNTKGRTKQDTNTVTIGVTQPTRWAVLIGIADYEGRSSDLWHPDEDAKEMEQELLEFGYPSSNIKMLLNRQAKANAIADAIEWLVTNEKAGDEVVFFYSGHGYRAPDSEGWDADVESDGHDEGIVTHDFYGLPDGWLKEQFAAIESTEFALLFGSCHSGGMFDDNDDFQESGRIIASACKADQYGWDYLQLGNTLWGYYFVDEGLLDNNAYSVEAAHVYAYSRVTAMQPDSQPQLYDGISGDFDL